MESYSKTISPSTMPLNLATKSDNTEEKMEMEISQDVNNNTTAPELKNNSDRSVMMSYYISETTGMPKASCKNQQSSAAEICYSAKHKKFRKRSFTGSVSSSSSGYSSATCSELETTDTEGNNKSKKTLPPKKRRKFSLESPRNFFSHHHHGTLISPFVIGCGRIQPCINSNYNMEGVVPCTNISDLNKNVMEKLTLDNSEKSKSGQIYQVDSKVETSQIVCKNESKKSCDHMSTHTCLHKRICGGNSNDCSPSHAENVVQNEGKPHDITKSPCNNCGCHSNRHSQGSHTHQCGTTNANGKVLQCDQFLGNTCSQKLTCKIEEPKNTTTTFENHNSQLSGPTGHEQFIKTQACVNSQKSNLPRKLMNTEESTNSGKCNCDSCDNTFNVRNNVDNSPLLTHTQHVPVFSETYVNAHMEQHLSPPVEYGHHSRSRSGRGKHRRRHSRGVYRNYYTIPGVIPSGDSASGPIIFMAEGETAVICNIYIYSILQKKKGRVPMRHL